jgi:hypothetical protein
VLVTMWPSQGDGSSVSEHFQRQFGATILHEQLHPRRSAFHTHAYTDDDGRYAGSVQCDPRQIRFDPRRIGLDRFHR